MSGRKSARKGAVGERELAAIFRDHGYDIQRGGSLSFGTAPDLSGLPGIHIECKRCQQLRIPDWMKQAAEDAKKFKDGMPAVFFRRNREPWLVCMNLEDWLSLYSRQKTTEAAESSYQPTTHSNHGG